MAFTKEKGDMNSNSAFAKIDRSDSKKIFIYFFGYCMAFFFFHLMLTSVFSFFHFLLDHEMGTIESWLSRNGWEIITISKVLSFISLVSLSQVNSYKEIKFIKNFTNMNLYPTKKSFVFIIFLLVMFYSLLNQFGGGIQSNQILDEIFFSSFIGAASFYGLDIFYLIYLVSYFELKVKEIPLVFIICLFFFMVSSKLVLPYISKYSVFLVIHFTVVFYFAWRKNLGDILLYLIVIVAPMSSIFGMDLVWDNSYSIFSYQHKLPVVGVLLIWITGLIYYRVSKLD